MSIQAVQPKFIVSDPVTYLDSVVAALKIPAKTLVLSVRAVVVTAFAGTSPTVDVGDSDPDGWVDNGDVTEGTIGSYIGTAGNGAGYAAPGKYYETADTIDVTIGGTDLTAGAVIVVAEVVELKDLVA